MGGSEARPTARGRTVKGSQTGTWRGPQAYRPRTRGPRRRRRGTRRLSFYFPNPGCWAAPDKTGSSLRGAEWAKGPLRPGADNCPSCPRASAAGAIGLPRTRGRHPHGPRPRHAGSGPARRTRTRSRQGRANIFFERDQRMMIPTVPISPERNGMRLSCTTARIVDRRRGIFPRGEISAASCDARSIV